MTSDLKRLDSAIGAAVALIPLRNSTKFEQNHPRQQLHNSHRKLPSKWRTTRENSLTCEFDPRFRLEARTACISFLLEITKSTQTSPASSAATTKARTDNLKSYVPRKCSATNRIIKAKDHASVQISVGKVDDNGRLTGESQVYALCGFVRAMGESDDSLNRLAQRDGLLKNVWSGSLQR